MLGAEDDLRFRGRPEAHDADVPAAQEDAVRSGQATRVTAVQHRRRRHAATDDAAAHWKVGDAGDVVDLQHDARLGGPGGSRRAAGEHAAKESEQAGGEHWSQATDRRAGRFSGRRTRYRVGVSDEPRQRRVVLVDADGRPTDDPASVVAGEITEHDPAGGLRRRRPFFLTREELPRLPVGESAFLLWVLAALVAVWAIVGLALHLS
jgi:hypothetical protein